MAFEQYYAGALHEAAHAVVAAIFGREILEISIIEDQDGGGYVRREQRESSPHDVLEEILISLAGEEAPYLWGNWPTNAEHDRSRISDLLAKDMLPLTLDFSFVHEQLKAILENSQEAISALANAVWNQKVMSGNDALEIIEPRLPDVSAIADTVDTIIQTQSELSAVLGYFPYLRQCWHEAGSPVLENTFIGNLLTCLRDDFIEVGLVAVETALASLLQKFTPSDLSEQIRDLFAEGSRSESRWEKSWTELTALAYINDRGLLSMLGWPVSNCDTPPFDCVISVGGQLVPCDIKSSIGSGFSLASSAVQSVVRQWAIKNGKENLACALRYRGTLSQEVVGPALKEALRNFRAEVANMKSIPSGPLKLDLGKVRCEVFIGASALNTNSGGIQGADPLAISLMSTYDSHVSQKAKMAKEQNHTPFLLIYVQTPGSGMSDLKTASVFKSAITSLSSAAATLKNDAGELWLGSILLDFRQLAPRIVCCLREDAAWPNGVMPKVIAASFGAELVSL
jgi:hypothetical protein